jgi:hypothetical protein
VNEHHARSEHLAKNVRSATKHPVLLKMVANIANAGLAHRGTSAKPMPPPSEKKPVSHRNSPVRRLQKRKNP